MNIADYYKKIIEAIGEDPNREGLKKTPERAARAMTYLTQGYTQDIKEIVNGATFQSDVGEMVIAKDIELYSLCEHHLLPFIGKCHIAYLPDGKILGLSKIARIVDHFSRRLQVQEELTKQIANCIMDFTNAKGVGVIIKAKHLCMMMRGVEKQNCIMSTSVMLGILHSQSNTRAEFLNLIRD